MVVTPPLPPFDGTDLHTSAWFDWKILAVAAAGSELCAGYCLNCTCDLAAKSQCSRLKKDEAVVETLVKSVIFNMLFRNAVIVVLMLQWSIKSCSCISHPLCK